MGTGDPTADRDRTTGLRDERPRASPVRIGAAVGGLWGFLGYQVLWEGRPFSVDRSFVTSFVGWLALLPVRGILWAIHLAERIVGRSFDLSGSTVWIGALAAVLGAMLLACVVALVRAVLERVRGSTARARPAVPASRPTDEA